MLLANTATADTFNSEIKLHLSDNDSYSVSLAPSYRYYLNVIGVWARGFNNRLVLVQRSVSLAI
jgi:hypothetical protein